MVIASLLLMTLAPSLWEPVPLISAAQRQAGFLGGEGGQWPRGLAVDSTGMNLLLAIDVAGVYRSGDGGTTWRQSGVGYTPRGMAAVAFDPRDSSRAVAVAMNSSPLPDHGLYLTEDGGASWRSVYRAETGNNEFREQLAFDPASYDRASGETKVVYWSRIRHDKPSWGEVKPNPGLYVSRDAARTWSRVPESEPLGGAILRAHPEGHRLWAATEKGLFLYDPFQDARPSAVLEGEVTGVDVSPQHPRRVWASQRDRILRSDDNGRTWSALPTGIVGGGSIVRPDGVLRHVKVSPADPERVFVWSDQEPNQWDWPRFVSHDGGQSWRVSTKDSTGAFLPDNARQGVMVWHPTDPQTAWSWGGDWPTKSTDGGLTFRYSGQGVNAILVGGMFSFSLAEPDTLFFGSQDYNGAVTRDRGRTWTYTNISGQGWGGFAYGGYALDGQTLVAGDASSWGGPRRLKVSQDGGRTWADTGLDYEGYDAAYGDPRHAQVVFAGSLRSVDRGRTWARMVDCAGVFTHGPDGSLYGLSRGDQPRVLRSTDHGATWTTVAAHSGGLTDLAIGPQGEVYATTRYELRLYSGGQWTTVPTPVDQRGERRYRTVATDPQDRRVVYLGGGADLWSTSHAVLRSLDGGRTWANLTRTTMLGPGEFDGGREATCVRVHPGTRELWVATGCYGIWRHPGPQ